MQFLDLLIGRSPSPLFTWERRTTPGGLRPVHHADATAWQTADAIAAKLHRANDLLQARRRFDLGLPFPELQRIEIAGGRKQRILDCRAVVQPVIETSHELLYRGAATLAENLEQTRDGGMIPLYSANSMHAVLTSADAEKAATRALSVAYELWKGMRIRPRSEARNDPARVLPALARLNEFLAGAFFNRIDSDGPNMQFRTAIPVASAADLPSPLDVCRDLYRAVVTGTLETSDRLYLGAFPISAETWTRDGQVPPVRPVRARLLPESAAALRWLEDRVDARDGLIVDPHPSKTFAPRVVRNFASPGLLAELPAAAFARSRPVMDVSLPPYRA